MEDTISRPKRSLVKVLALDCPSRFPGAKCTPGNVVPALPPPPPNP
jgi:hypothetical protein